MVFKKKGTIIIFALLSVIILITAFTACDKLIPIDGILDAIPIEPGNGLLDAILPETEHQHSWADATCSDPKTCTTCGETKGEALGHDWIDATCDEPQTCTVCDQTQGKALGHVWTSATCNKPKTCIYCNETEGKALGHSWTEATCEKPKTCSKCKETEGSALGHSWDAATCEKAKTCSKCKKTEGSARGHSWTAATCERAKTCFDCNKTEGSALGHSWTAATCEKAKTCSKCKKTEGSALGHSWTPATNNSPKTCTRCNKTEGTPLVDTYAWLAAYATAYGDYDASDREYEVTLAAESNIIVSMVYSASDNEIILYCFGTNNSYSTLTGIVLTPALNGNYYWLLVDSLSCRISGTIYASSFTRSTQYLNYSYNTFPSGSITSARKVAATSTRAMLTSFDVYFQDYGVSSKDLGFSSYIY